MRGKTFSRATKYIRGRILAGTGRFLRSQYKDVWNSVSKTEDEAKIAVSGYTDEALYRSTGEDSRNMLSEALGLRPDDVVLEIGCGVGRAGAYIAPCCKEWVGVDVSENMLSHARNRLAHLPNVRLVAGTGYGLTGIPSGSFDSVYCTVVFMHLDEWERYNYIKEGFRVLKPGGGMMVDNVDLTTDAGWKFFEDHCKIPPMNRPPHISKTSTPDELRTYFTRAGFERIVQNSHAQWVVTYGHKPA